MFLARGLRHRQRCRAVMPSPDQRGRRTNAFEHRAGHRRDSKLLHPIHERGSAGLHARQVVRANPLPLFAEAPSHAFEIEHTLTPQAIVRGTGRRAQKCLERSAERWCRLKRRETQRVNQHQRCKWATRGRGKVHRDRTAQGMAHEDRWLRTCALDEIVEPVVDEAGRWRAFKKCRSSVPGQIGRDHAMRGRQRRDRMNPLRTITARSMQQDDGRTTTTFKNGRRDAIQAEPPLSHRQRLDQ